MCSDSYKDSTGTDLGSFTSALRCQQCGAGWCLPGPREELQYEGGKFFKIFLAPALFMFLRSYDEGLGKRNC